MSLYRIWRPRTFAELVGQDAVVATLGAAIASGRLAHAYLFSGPRGSGKTSAAKILARCVNCAAGPTAVPDNTCENCRAILAGTALDVLEIDAASNRGIEEIRALREAVKFAPATMRKKVYIVDEAHMLTKEGANAFLKTLEEPPPHALFILATTEPEKLPVTILSRCQRYAFARISIPVMIGKLKEVAAGEDIAIDDEALAAVAYRADGGLRDALTILEQLAAFSAGRPITVPTLDRAFGSSGREFTQALVEAIVASDAVAALRTVEAASDAGTDSAVLMRSVIAELRHLLVARVDPHLLARDLAPEDAQNVAARSASVPANFLVRALRAFGDALWLARSGGDPRLELETALLKFILSDEERLPHAADSGTGARAPAPAASQPAERDIAAPPSLSGVKAAWQTICNKAAGERQSLRGPLSQATVAALETNAIVLQLTDLQADILRPHLHVIETAIAQVLGVPLRVTLRLEAATRPKQGPPHRAQTQRSPEADDPDALFDYANERIR